jgi:hypothetical protein
MATKKNWQIMLMAFLLVPLLMLGLSNPVQAEEKVQGSDFYMAPLYPENQTDQNLGYFVLKVTPGQMG